MSRFYYPKVGGVERVVQTLAEGIHGDEWNVRELASAPQFVEGAETINGVQVTSSNYDSRSSVDIARWQMVKWGQSLST